MKLKVLGAVIGTPALDVTGDDQWGLVARIRTSADKVRGLVPALRLVGHAGPMSLNDNRFKIGPPGTAVTQSAYFLASPGNPFMSIRALPPLISAQWLCASW